MENREYYTPEVSDLFIGYKCQRRITRPNYVEKHFYEWHNYTLNEHYFGAGYEEGQDWNYYEVELRTSFLCKQDIVDLGWECYNTLDFTNETLGVDIREFYRKSYISEELKGFYWELMLNIKTKQLGIWLCSEINPNGTRSFIGTCKSKNELKKLMKDYLNIPV